MNRVPGERPACFPTSSPTSRTAVQQAENHVRGVLHSVFARGRTLLIHLSAVARFSDSYYCTSILYRALLGRTLVPPRYHFIVAPLPTVFVSCRLTQRR